MFSENIFRRGRGLVFSLNSVEVLNIFIKIKQLLIEIRETCHGSLYPNN